MRRTSAKRVAFRHLLAGILEAPPRFVAEIEKRVLPLFAGHLWAETETEVEIKRRKWARLDETLVTAKREAESEIARVASVGDPASWFWNQGWKKVDKRKRGKMTLVAIPFPWIEGDSVRWGVWKVRGERTRGSGTEIPGEPPEQPEQPESPLTYWDKPDDADPEEWERTVEESKQKHRREMVEYNTAYGELERAQDRWDWHFKIQPYQDYGPYDSAKSALTAAKRSPDKGDYAYGYKVVDGRAVGGAWERSGAGWMGTAQDEGGLWGDWNRRMEGRADQVYAEAVEHIIEEASRHLKRLKDYSKTSQKHRRGWLADKLMLIQSVKKYATKPAHMKYLSPGAMEFVVPVDVTGWRYLDRKTAEIKNEWLDRAAEAEGIGKRFIREVRALEVGQETSEFIFPKIWVNAAQVTRTHKESYTFRWAGYGPHSPQSLGTIKQDIRAAAGDSERVCMAKAEEVEDARDVFKTINLSVEFHDNSKGYGGWWSSWKGEMKAFLGPERFRGIRTPEQFDDAILRVKRLVRHESQHLAQSMLDAWVHGNKDADRAGMPSRDVFTSPHVSPSGTPKPSAPSTIYDQFGKERMEPGEKWTPRIEHQEREVEFYTNLTDDIDVFERTLRKIPKPYWPAYARIYVGLSDKATIEAFVTEIGSRYSNRLTVEIKAAWRLLRFKGKNKPKWRKAVKEFYNEMRRRGYRLQGGLVPFDSWESEKLLQKWRTDHFKDTGDWYTWREVPGVGSLRGGRVDEGYTYEMYDVLNVDPDDPKTPYDSDIEPGKKRVMVLVRPNGKVTKVR
jgi:hypothetical protein